MKQGKDAPGFPPKPWTIARSEHTGRQPVWQAINLESGERLPMRTSYDEAKVDLKKYTGYAEPWGV